MTSDKWQVTASKLNQKHATNISVTICLCLWYVARSPFLLVFASKGRRRSDAIPGAYSRSSPATKSTRQSTLRCDQTGLGSEEEICEAIPPGITLQEICKSTKRWYMQFMQSTWTQLEKILDDGDETIPGFKNSRRQSYLIYVPHVRQASCFKR